MAQRIAGLDIGAATVRVAVFEATLRSLRLVRIYRHPIARPAGPGTTAEARDKAVATALAQLHAVGAFDADTLTAALPGEQGTWRRLSLPFTDPRQIQETLGFELERYLPFSHDDIVYDHMVLERQEARSELVAVAARKEDFERFLARLTEADVDPRYVGLAPLEYTHLARQLAGRYAAPVAIVDVGAARTDVAVVHDGLVWFTRTIPQGGDRVTAALARALEVEWAEAESLKVDEGIVATGDTEMLDPRQSRIASAVRQGLEPLLTQIGLTLQAAVVQTPEIAEIDQVLLCGGGSALRGVYDALEEALDVPVHPLRLDGFEWWDAGDAEPGDALAVALALRATRMGVRDVPNFRRGIYAYRGHATLSPGRIGGLAAVAGVVLALLGLKAWWHYQGLAAARAQQHEALRNFAKEVVGRPLDDPDTLLAVLARVPSRKDLAIFPDMSATAVFYDITAVLDDVNHTSRSEVLAMRESGGGAKEDRAKEAEASQKQAGPAGAGAAGAGASPAGRSAPAPGPANRAGKTPEPTRPPGPAQAIPPAVNPARMRAPQAASPSRALDAALKAARSAAALRGGARGPAPGLGTVRSAPLPPAPGVFQRPSPGVVRAPGGFGARVRPGGGASVGAPHKGHDLMKPPAGARPPDEHVQPGGGAPGAKEGGDNGEAKGDDRLIAEFESVSIDEDSVSLKGEANSIEAVTLLEQRLREHRCLQHVELEGTDRINFERHRGWYSFRIKADVECKQPTEEKGKGNAAARGSRGAGRKPGN